MDPAEVREWNIQSLPSDDLSVENGLMVTRGRRWPLMVDPQGQANRWVRHMGREKSIVITKLSDSTYLRKLESPRTEDRVSNEIYFILTYIHIYMYN